MKERKKIKALTERGKDNNTNTIRIYNYPTGSYKTNKEDYLVENVLLNNFTDKDDLNGFNL